MSNDVKGLLLKSLHEVFGNREDTRVSRVVVLGRDTHGVREQMLVEQVLGGCVNFSGLRGQCGWLRSSPKQIFHG